MTDVLSALESEPGRIPLFGVKRETDAFGAEYAEAARRAILSGRFLHGPQSYAFANELSLHIGRPAALTTNGTASLVLLLRAIAAGPGDEIIVPGMTFVATANAVLAVGATPVVVDVDDTASISTEHVRAAVTRSTKAVIAVSLYGTVIRHKDLRAVLPPRVHLLEDACQSFNAVCTCCGRKSGALAGVYAAATSFYPSKVLGAVGNGGAVFAEKEVVERVEALRSQVWAGAPASNLNMDEVQAAVLRVKLPKLVAWHERRCEIAARYAAAIPQSVVTERGSAWAVFMVDAGSAERREALSDALDAKSIQWRRYYRRAIADEPLSSMCRVVGDQAVSRAIAAHWIAIPFHPFLSDAEVDEVIGVVTAQLSA